MYMFLIAYVLLIKMVDMDRLFTVTGPEKLNKICLELSSVIFYVRLRIFTNNEHLPNVRFRHGVLFESVGISALLFCETVSICCENKMSENHDDETAQRLLTADLTVPSQTLETLGLHTVCDIFR
jgi:hypothetical protein